MLMITYRNGLKGLQNWGSGSDSDSRGIRCSGQSFSSIKDPGNGSYLS